MPDLKGNTPDLSDLETFKRGKRILLQMLSVHDLSYQYPHTEYGIHSINFALRKGSLTVITGRIGSGLLPKERGSVYWNDQLIEDPMHFFVPPQTAYTPQVPSLFSQSLRENILLGLNGTDQDLARTIQIAAFSQDLAQMPQGLETWIGSKGVRLSGGQQQRVAAARMLIRQPELLVFDDLSSALDLETEQLLWSRLLALNSGSQSWKPTFLVVSHRPFVLEKADQVLVMEKGILKSQGDVVSSLPCILQHQSPIKIVAYADLVGYLFISFYWGCQAT